jgi:hypothetical protein
MDLRAPLHDECSGDETSRKFNKGSAPWLVNDSNASSAIDSRLYEKIIYCHLCRMYVASEAMELGSESRFTGQVLFHRYVRQFYRSMQQKQHPQQQNRDVVKQLSFHLGTVAAACLFLGCKMEEEPRRIRDVINLSHILKFSLGDTDENGTNTKVVDLAQNNNIVAEPVTIIELPSPPPLDETYWIAKEQMVSTEQHVLRMLQFDTSVCHPHRCVLIVMEILGFGTGKYQSGNGDGTEQGNWLLNSDQSESVIIKAWMILNDAPLDGQGVALQYPVVLLSCASISLAAEGTSSDSSKYDDGDRVLPLPASWWRSLNLTDEDMMMAKDTLQRR